MSVTGVHNAVRTAVSAAITSGGLTCRKYDTWDIRAGNIATLGLLEVGLSEGADQKYGARVVTVPVIVYQIVGNSIDASLAYQETNVEKAINGLGVDRTLGGLVAHSDIGSSPTQPSYYRAESGAAYSVVTFNVDVMPFSNVGG